MTRAYLKDSLLQLSDAVTTVLTTHFVMQVASADKIIDAGPATFRGTLWFEVSALEVTTGDEFAEIHIQGSNSATFANTIHDLAMMKLGGATATGNSAADAAGLYQLQFCNVINLEHPTTKVVTNTTYRYLRGTIKCGGTTPSITIDSAYIVLDKA